ncbi:tripartite tricarboxylate transporter permease [Candidatus Pyrohabitans sp.]
MAVFALFGCIFGIVTGLVPGLHVNNVVIILVSLSAFLIEWFGLLPLLAFIVALSVVHSFVNYVPAILLGAPQEDNVLSILPGHRLLSQGRGYEAIRLTVLGGLGATLFSALALPLLYFAMPQVYPTVRQHIPLLLTAVLAYMVYLEKGFRKRLYAALVVLYSGALGYIILNYPLLSPQYALFPALTGFFGISTILTSLHLRSAPPEQSLAHEKGFYPHGAAAGTAGGILAGLLPGIGSAQSALLVQSIFGRRNERNFLVAHGGVNTAAAIFALLALYLIGNPRSGASVAAATLIGEADLGDLVFMLAIAMLASPFAAFATLLIARSAVRRIGAIDYTRLSIFVLLFLMLSILIFTGLYGMLIAITSTATGLLAVFSGVRRSHCMGVLILPTILYFLGI